MKFDPVKLPKRISPCPIIEAVVELRFNSTFQEEVIAGIAFEKFKDVYPSFEKLPILELPPIVRASDPILMYSPLVRLRNNDFLLQIGPKCVSLVCPKEYKGWPVYRSRIEEMFQRLDSIGLVGQPQRLGVRYIDFFEKTDIFSKVKTDFSLAAQSLIGNKNTVRTEFPHEGFTVVLQFSSHALLNETVKGSWVDIDILATDGLSPLTTIMEKIEIAHGLQKKIFFGILSDGFLSELNPEY